MKREELIKKLCEIAIHVGVGLSENTEPTIEGIVEELRLTNCGECKSLAGELESLSLASGEDDGYVYGITADLKQYITNLLYFAHEDNEEFNRIPSKFDEWVGEQVENIDGYFKSAPHPSPTAEKPMTAEDTLYDTMYDSGYTYVSFPAFVENESSVDVYDVVCRAMEEYASLKPTVEVREVRTFLCNRCGAICRLFDGTTPLGCCVVPVKHRTSGICGGEFIEITTKDRQ